MSFSGSSGSSGGGSSVNHTIVEYFSEHSGYKCGYCKSPDTNFSHGMWAHSMDVEAYQNLLNRGWRRSGSYLYKPTNSLTCCPMYTISCHAQEFKISQSQKKVVKKFVNHVLNTSSTFESSVAASASVPASASPNISTRSSKQNEQSGSKKSIEELLQPISNHPGFTVKKVKYASEEFDKSLEESHKIYKKYQMAIHNETESECSFKQFKRFLCQSPLKSEKEQLGSYHYHYFLNSVLVAVGVVDILPSCLSSVYFFYDPELSNLSLGTFGALYEIYIVRQNPTLQFYYLGFYIHSCVKMRYKGNYAPSFLLCDKQFTWHPIEDIKPKLDKEKYFVFSGDETEIEPDPMQALILYKRRSLTYPKYCQLRSKSDDKDDKEITEYVKLVGTENSKSMLLYRDGNK